MATVDYKLSNGKTIRGVDAALDPATVLEAAREQTGDASLAFAFENQEQGGALLPTDNPALARTQTDLLSDNEPLPGVEYEAPTPVERFGAGMNDVVSGVRQAATEVVDPEGTAAFTLEENSRRAAYDRGRKGTGNRGLDWWRVAGNVATSAAPGGVIGTPATTVGRVAAGAGVGAGLGYVSFQPGTAEGQTAPSDRIIPTVVGSAAGGVGAGLFDIGGYLARKTTDSAVNTARAATSVFGSKPVSAQADELYTAARNMAGVDVPEQLPIGLRRVVEADIREAQSSGIPLTPEALARKLELEAAGYSPRTGQITRDPKTFAKEENQRARSTSEAGRLQQQLEEQARKMREDITAIAGKYGESIDGLPGEKGRVVMDTIEAEWKRSGEDVSKAYKAARDKHGDVRADVAPLITEVADLAFEGGKTAVGDLAELAINRMKRLGLIDADGNVKEGASLAMSQLEDLRKSISRTGTIKGTTQAETLRAKAIITNLIDDIAETSSAGDVFGPARAQARARFQMFEGKALDDVLSGKADPERFFQRHVIGASVSDLKKTMAALEASPDGAPVANMMRREMMDAILEKAGALNGDGFIDPRGLEKGIKLVGRDKIKQVLGADVLESLEKNKRFAEWLFTEPGQAMGGSLINRSRTAAEGERISRWGDGIGVGAVLNKGQDFLTEQAEREAVNKSVRGGIVPTVQPAPSGSEVVANTMARGRAVYDAWLGGQNRSVQDLLLQLERASQHAGRGATQSALPAFALDFMRNR